MLRLLLITLLSLFIFQCSKTSTPEQPAHTFILDEVPQHIQKVENLSVFPGDAKPMYSMELIPVQSFGDTGERYVIQIVGCIVDDKGRVIIQDTINKADSFPYKLYVFNADGTYHNQLGGQGKGPGEYGLILGLQAKAGKVFVLDYTSLRLNEYSTKDYSFVHSILLESWKSDEGLEFGYVEARNDGNYLVIFSDIRSKTGRLEIKYQVMDNEGNRVNVEPLVFPDGFKIKVGQSMQPTMALTFLGKTISALSQEDALYVVWTKDFLIKKYDAKGEYQSAIYYPIQGSPFDLNEYTETQLFSPKARDIEKAFATMDEDLPETFPVVAKLMVDDENRIWVAVPAGVQHDAYEWWILNQSRELLAKLLLPRDQPIYDIKNGYLYSKKTNEETGAEFVVKYRIALTEK